MKASIKKQFERIPNEKLEGLGVNAINRNSGDILQVAILSATSSIIVASFKDKFQETTLKFRRDKGTQLGGDYRLDVESILA